MGESMDSRDVATAAVRIAVTGSFEEENEVKTAMHRKGITAAAVNVIINVTILFYIAFYGVYFARVPLLG